MTDPDPSARGPFTFDAEIIHWRGPSPYFYAPVPPDQAEGVRRAAKSVSYGWGMIPVEAAIGGVAFTTALFPKDGTYLLPIKAAVRRAANLTAGDTVAVVLKVRAGSASL
jgi:hypothetical protein